MNNDFGDFQTPPALVKAVLNCLASSGKIWPRVLEPTCGRGNFIEELLKLSTPPQEIHAIEIQDRYVKEADKFTNFHPSTRVILTQASVFELNFYRDLHWQEKGPLLVVGNPPWVTNADLGTRGSINLPHKKNIKRLRGIEARTGSSNFDIAEAIWLKLIKELAPEQPTIALLCKIAVARNVLQFAFDNNLPITHASVHKIDAKRWFGAAVEACLFSLEVGPGERRYEAAVYNNLSAVKPELIMGIVDNHLVADMKAYTSVGVATGPNPLVWRQGLKHDAATVMELLQDNSGDLRNKLGEIVNVEHEYIYPLLKSSDLFHDTTSRPIRSVIVPQKRLGEDRALLKQAAPRLWEYLLGHTTIFEKRQSSIYKGQSPFAIFGIGDYSFASYKVAISGLHKSPRFRAIGPLNGRPVMFDDTCYFIPCYSPEQAAFLASVFNDPACLDFLNSMLFLDAKRPVTKKLLQHMNLASLWKLIARPSLILRANAELARLRTDVEQVEVIWPTSAEEFLADYLESARCASASPNNGDTARQLTLLPW